MTANKLLTAAMIRLASASSTGMPATDSGSQTQGQGPLDFTEWHVVCLSELKCIVS